MAYSESYSTSLGLDRQSMDKKTRRPSQAPIKADSISDLSSAALVCRDPQFRHEWDTSTPEYRDVLTGLRGVVLEYSLLLRCKRCQSELSVRYQVTKGHIHRTSGSYRYADKYLHGHGRLAASEVRYEQFLRYSEQPRKTRQPKKKPA